MLLFKKFRFPILSTLLGILLSVCSFAQQSWQMPFDTSSKWKSNYTEYDSDFRIYNYEFYVSGVTVINNLAYFKIFENKSYRYDFVQGPPPNVPYYILCQTFPAYCNPDIQHGIYYCAMRSDSMKVFGVWPNATNEVLFYDFNLSVGNLLPNAEFFDTTLLVVKIDTILTGNQYRRRFACIPTDPNNSCNFTDTVFYYDGIGNQYGFLMSPICSPMMEQWGSLDCYSEFGLPALNQSNVDCDFSIGINETKLSEEKILLYPNPASGLVTISTPMLQFASFSIFSPQGKLIRHQEFDPINDFQFDTKLLSPGIYFIEALSEKKTLFRTKLIVTGN